MGTEEPRVDGDLLEADPESEVVGGKAPFGAECVEIGGDHLEVIAGGPRDGEVVLAEGTPGEMADHGTGGHAQHHRPDHLHDRRQEAHGVGGIARAVGGRSVDERGAQRLEERPPRLECADDPLAAGDGRDGDAEAGARRGESGGRADLQLGDAGK